MRRRSGWCSCRSTRRASSARSATRSPPRSSLLALQPAFVAARSARASWGRILLGWLVSVLVCQIPDAVARVVFRGSRAPFPCWYPRSSLPSVSVSRARLFRDRRVLVPALLALPYAVLARARTRCRGWKRGAGARAAARSRECRSRVPRRDHRSHRSPTERARPRRFRAGSRLTRSLPSTCTESSAPCKHRSRCARSPSTGCSMLLRQEEAIELRADGLVRCSCRRA